MKVLNTPGTSVKELNFNTEKNDYKLVNCTILSMIKLKMFSLNKKEFNLIV